MVQNLIIILGDDFNSAEPIIFPCEDKIMIKLCGGLEDNNCIEFKANQPLAVMWDESYSFEIKKQWYVGFYLDKNSDSSFRVDHLTRAKNTENDLIWTRPRIPDIQDVQEWQILPTDVCGYWDLSGRKYILTNIEEIRSVFKEIYG